MAAMFDEPPGARVRGWVGGDEDEDEGEREREGESGMLWEWDGM